MWPCWKIKRPTTWENPLKLSLPTLSRIEKAFLINKSRSFVIFVKRTESESLWLNSSISWSRTRHLFQNRLFTPCVILYKNSKRSMVMSSWWQKNTAKILESISKPTWWAHTSRASSLNNKTKNWPSSVKPSKPNSDQSLTKSGPKSQLNKIFVLKSNTKNSKEKSTIESWKKLSTWWYLMSTINFQCLCLNFSMSMKKPKPDWNPTILQSRSLFIAMMSINSCK